jgi:hypothetical protein
MSTTHTAGKFPYTSEVRCRVCHPAELEQPPFLSCKGTAPRGGTTVQRILICDNCGAQEADFQDIATKAVTWASYKAGA